MKCGDCGGEILGTETELEAIVAGVTLCDECMASMEAERALYEQIMRDEGYECVFHPEHGFRAVRWEPAAEAQAGQG